LERRAAAPDAELPGRSQMGHELASPGKSWSFGGALVGLTLGEGHLLTEPSTSSWSLLAPCPKPQTRKF